MIDLNAHGGDPQAKAASGSRRLPSVGFGKMARTGGRVAPANRIGSMEKLARCKDALYNTTKSGKWKN